MPGKKITGGPSLSRLKSLALQWAKAEKGRRAEDYQPDVPPLDETGYLVGYLFEAGPTIDGGMGSSPLSHGELYAWQFNSGIELQPWETRFLRALSREYLAQLQRAEKPDCVPPWGMFERRAMVAKKIDEMFG